ncbi:MAG: hypothetical protein M0R80_10525 [Proteobacteria bacterium]|jgi:hypothetical protein|nr:hypothetical protein [Pseudomonadota bacterium]
MWRIVRAAAAAVLVFAGCESYPTEVTFKLYGQGASFSGIYAIDDGDGVDFLGEESSTDVYLFSETVEIEDAITIDVFPDATADTDDDDETDMTDLTCKVFDSDDELLYEKAYSITSTHMKTFVFSLDGTTTDDADVDTD